MYQPRNNAPLDEVAQLAGFPGKLGMGGAKVWEAYLAGEIARDPRLLRGRRGQYLPAVPALPAAARGVLTRRQYREGDRAPAQAPARPGQAALARIPASSGMIMLEIDALDAAGRGVARVAGKVVFVEGALAGETVEARLARVASPSSTARASPRSCAPRPRGATPRCPHFGVCGGCATQHAGRAHPGRGEAARARGQPVAYRQGAGRTTHAARRSTARSGATGIARACRCATCESKGGALVGFRERKSHLRRRHDAAARSCRRAISALIRSSARADRRRSRSATACRRSSSRRARRRRCCCSATCCRSPPRTTGRCCGPSPTRTASSLAAARGPGYARRRSIRPSRTPLYYSLPEFGVRISFQPADFTQVNPAVNRLLVSRALRAARSAAGRAHRRPVLRPRQLRAADRQRAARR